MWIIIVIVIVAVVISLISSSKNYNDVRNVNISNGGLHKSYERFIYHLENNYGMELETDTGRSFTYSKAMIDKKNNEGKLIVGIKLSITDEPRLFSKFKNVYNIEYSGMDVSGVDFNKTSSIDECIAISLEQIKLQGSI